MDGLVLLDKPEGMTSFSAVSKVRKIFGEKKAGHTGTLDPMATGVLPVLLGRATRLSDYLLSADKAYEATVRLGVTTDTCDITGRVLAETKVSVSGRELSDTLDKFRGEIMQTPPMFSAIKQNGQPLYKLARKGIETERSPRAVTIHTLLLKDRLSNDEFTISVNCSKGTYIRTLCADIGKALGCGATLTGLKRTATGGFSIADCVSLEQLITDPLQYLKPPLCAVEHLPFVSVTEKQAVRFCHGGELAFERLSGAVIEENAPVRVMFGDELIGIGIGDTQVDALRVKCVLDFRQP